MKITNLVLAALMIVAAPSFANTAVTAKALETAISKLPVTQYQSAARAVGLSNTASASQIAAAVVSAINAGTIKESQILGSNKAIRADLIAVAMSAKSQSKMPVDQGQSRGQSTKQLDQIGNQTRNSGDNGSVSGQEAVRGDADDLSNLLNTCSITNNAPVISGVCDQDKLPAKDAQTWKTLGLKIVAAAKDAGIKTGAAARASMQKWNSIVNATVMSHFGVSCQDANTRAVGLSAADGCHVLDGYVPVTCAR